MHKGFTITTAGILGSLEVKFRKTIVEHWVSFTSLADQVLHIASTEPRADVEEIVRHLFSRQLRVLRREDLRKGERASQLKRLKNVDDEGKYTCKPIS